MSNEALVELHDVKQHFTIKKTGGGKAVLYAVDGVSLTISRGETLGLVGESGCGKSTLGKSVLGLYKLTDGQVIFDGDDVSKLKAKARKDFSKKVQLIFQDPSSSLNPRRRAAEILAEPFIIHRELPRGELRARAEELCDLVGLSPSYLDRYPHEMSGGQKQRIGIARAIALRPQLIVCDEPVSALDVSIQAQVINLLQDLQEKLGMAYLFISHNLSVVKHCCWRIGVMYLGKIVELAPSDTIYAKPMHPYTQALISAIPTIGGERVERIVLKGDLPSPTAPPSGCAFHTRCPNAREQCRLETPALREYSPGHFAACHFAGE